MILSASKIRNWMNCQMQVKLQKEHPDVEQKQWGKTHFGTIIHFCLEHYNNHLDNADEACHEAKQLFLQSWDDPESAGLPAVEKWHFGRGTNYGSLRERGIQIIDEYHEKQKWEKRMVLATEHPFIVPIGDHHLRGFVDLVETKVSGGGKPVVRVVDFKTASKQPTLADLKFNIQFTVYVYASLQPEFWLGNPDFNNAPAMENGKRLYEDYLRYPRRGIWYHLWANKELDAGGREDGDFMRLYRAITAIVDAIDKDVYVPDISADTCTFCDYKEHCPVVIPILDKLNSDDEDEEFF